MRPRLAARGRLFDRQGAFHARLGMAGHGAEEGVAAGFELGRDRGLVFGDEFGGGDLFAVFLDRHVVFDRGRVVEVDRPLAGFGAQLFGVVGERRRVRHEFQGAAAAARGRAAAFFGFFTAAFFSAFFVPAAGFFFLTGDRFAVLLGFEDLAGVHELGFFVVLLVLGVQDAE